jgi:hypothetical protein
MMGQKQIKLAKILTYSGTLPFIIAILILQFSEPNLNIKNAAIAYGAIIISFLSGIHWAAYLFFPDKCSINLLISSNILALIAWLSVIINCQPKNIILQILCFLSLLALDLNLRKASILPPWFFKLRCNATMIVVLCLFTLMIFT